MRTLISLALTLAYAPAFGYDALATHSNLTSSAADKSVLGNPGFYQTWGLKGTVDNLKFAPTTGGAQIPIKQLIVKGVREEDSGGRQGFHFFDPTIAQGKNGMQYCNWPRNADSRTWGLEGIGQAEPNAYSYVAARKAMVAAFSESNPIDRDRKFGLMFEAIGHVLHFLQDLAQPQHARNDVHLEFDTPSELTAIERRSRYEGWAAGTSVLASFALYPSYGNVKMTTAGSYWKNNGQGIAEYTNRNFVSQDSNFESVNGVIVANSKYPSPVPSGINTLPIADLWDPSICPAPGVPSAKAFCHAQGSVDFITNQVTDLYTNQPPQTNLKAAMFSIFNQDLETTGRPFNFLDFCENTKSADKLMTTNELTFPSAASFLIPRAIGYSAGMIDYFFRGKIDLYPHPNLTNDPTKIGKYLFANKSGVNENGQDIEGGEVIEGKVKLYYDGIDGYRHAVPNGEWQIPPLAPNGTGSTFEVDVSQVLPALNPPAKKYGVLIVVFTGRMGDEVPIGDSPGAVVAKEVRLPAPEFYWSRTGPGDFRLSFKLPNSLPQKLDEHIGANFTSSRLKVNGVDQPLGAYASNTECAVGAPLTWKQLWRSGTFSGGVMHALGNKAYFMDGGATQPRNRDADYFLEYRYGPVQSISTGQIHYGTPNAYVECSNFIQVEGIAPGAIVGVEYLVGSQSIFKFCAQIEVTAACQPGQEALEDVCHVNNRRLVLWSIQNARVMDKAISVRQATSTAWCAQ